VTSTTDTTQHPDVSEISEFTEGLLAPSRTAEIQHHLGDCSICADVQDSLEEIKGLLGTLPGAHRMPDDVAERIDAALAAEALLDATAPLREAAHVSRETTASPAIPAQTAPAAGDPGRTGRPAGRPAAATGPGRGSQTRHRRRNTVLGAVFGTAAVGVTVFLLQSQSSDGGRVDAASSKISASASDSQDFSETLQDHVQALLASGSAGNKSGDGITGDPRKDSRGSVSPMLESEPDVPPCVQRGTGRDDAVIAAEMGTYQGSSAYLVLMHAADATQVQAYVIEAACVDASPSGKGTVLLTRSYPRQ
jgi:hypothetical protein